MKAIFAFAMAAGLTVMPLAVQNAQAQLELTMGAGLNTPLGDFKDEIKNGWVFSTGVGYRIAPVLVVGAQVGFFGSNASDVIMEGLSPGSEVTTTIQQFAGYAKVLIPVGKHNVFAKGVLGSYRGIIKYSGPLGDAKGENTDPGYGIGGGVMVNGDTNTSFFLDVTYHHVSFDDTSVDTNFMSYSLGGVFRVNLFD